MVNEEKKNTEHLRMGMVYPTAENYPTCAKKLEKLRKLSRLVKPGK